MKKLCWIAGVALLLAWIAPRPVHSQTQVSSAGSDLTGQWQGKLEQGKGQRTVLKITKDGRQYKGVLYRIDQDQRAVAIPAITMEGGAIKFDVKLLNANYEGTLGPDGNSINGNVKLQNGELHALNLARVSGDAAWAVPEPPKPMPADAKPKFDVVTVKPSDPNSPGTLITIRGRHLMTVNTNVETLITFAFGLHKKQIINAPSWLTEKFDIDGVPDVEGQPNGAQMRLLIQDALTQRFGLKFHHEQQELPVYALTLAKGGPKMTVTADAPGAPGNFLFNGHVHLHVTNNTMDNFCKGLQEAVMDKPVVNQTGLIDRYDFDISWTPDQSQFNGRYNPPADDPAAPPSLYTVLQEQLGLKLENSKSMVDAFVIDKLEKPGEN